MSDFLLDTDVLIRCLRGVPETLQLTRGLTDEGDLHISIWSHLEVLTLAQADEDKKTLDFVAPFILHPINEPIAHRAANLLRRGRETGRPLTFGEAIIAATALHHGLTVVTYSPGNLERLGDLRLHPLAPEAINRGES